jgi:hypothetical protein
MNNFKNCWNDFLTMYPICMKSMLIHLWFIFWFMKISLNTKLELEVMATVINY